MYAKDTCNNLVDLWRNDLICELATIARIVYLNQMDNSCNKKLENVSCLPRTAMD